MKEIDQKKIIDAVIEKLSEKLEAATPTIFEKFDEACEEHGSDKKFKFPIGLSASITGHDTAHMKVEVDVYVSTKIHFSDSELVQIGEDMFDQAGVPIAPAPPRAGRGRPRKGAPPLIGGAKIEDVPEKGGNGHAAAHKPEETEEPEEVVDLRQVAHKAMQPKNKKARTIAGRPGRA
jgi:hypothetical protein